MKFLHIADVHLGCTRYQLAESQRDFFDAWVDVLRKFGIEEKVDFVLISGDFFHKRTVPPETMNYAVAGLQMMKDKGIPVLAIEGNHDQKYADSDYSWLRSLANWNLLYLLEPTRGSEGPRYEPWDDEHGRGGFFDVGRARVFGSAWYGASLKNAMPFLIDGMRKNRRDGAFHILMLHTDVEGHQKHPMPALSIASLNELKAVADYVALGHTHMHYEIDNWAFNPGSIEVTNIAEFREKRGVFVVEVDDENRVSARHFTDYTYRPFQRLPFDVGPFSDPRALSEAALDLVDREARRAEPGKPAPIIELTLRGRLSFPNSALELNELRDNVKKKTGALHVRVKNHTVPVELAIAADVDEEAGREKLERRVIEDLVFRDARYAPRAAEITEAVIGSKHLALNGEEPAKIADFIAAKLAQ